MCACTVAHMRATLRYACRAYETKLKRQLSEVLTPGHAQSDGFNGYWRFLDDVITDFVEIVCLAEATIEQPPQSVRDILHERTTTATRCSF